MQDYIHLYMGQNVVHVPDDGTTANIHGLDLSAGRIFVNNNDHQMYGELKISEFKLILRPLSSMRSEESIKLLGSDKSHFYKKGKSDPFDLFLFTPKEFCDLIGEGFDLFGLKEAGLAVYE